MKRLIRVENSGRQIFFDLLLMNYTSTYSLTTTYKSLHSDWLKMFAFILFHSEEKKKKRK
jgi:hypothetical protein